MMMTLPENLHHLICQFGVGPWSSCASWWEEFVTPDRLWALIPALFGTLIGGAVTVMVQTFLKRREQRAQLRERILMFVVTTMRITADMQNIQNALSHYATIKRESQEFWQAVHVIHFTPGLKAELHQLESLTRLDSAPLMTKAMHLYSEYASIVETVAYYNKIRERYFEERRGPNRDQEAIESLQTNMKNLVEFIGRTTLALLAETRECQALVYECSKRHFGSAEFLKLKEQ